MNEHARNFVVGLTALAGLLGFIYLVFIFGEVPAWVADTYRVTVTMDHAGGVTGGSRVRLNGVDVGYVESVRLREDAAEGVLIACQIESAYDIPSDARATAVTSLLGGGAQVAIRAERRPEVAVAAPPLPKDGSAVLHGRAPTDFATLTAEMERSVQQQLENFGRVTEKLVELSDQYILVGDRVATLLEERAVEDVDAGRVQANVTTLLARADARLAELHETIAQVNALLGDEQIHEDIRQTLANARLFSEDARRLTESTERNLDTLMRRFVAVADDLARTLDSVDGLVADARQGEGTLGRFVQDPALYNDLQDAAGRLSDVLREAQLLLEKWAAEGVPIQF